MDQLEATESQTVSLSTPTHSEYTHIQDEKSQTYTEPFRCIETQNSLYYARECTQYEISAHLNPVYFAFICEYENHVDVYNLIEAIHITFIHNPICGCKIKTSASHKHYYTLSSQHDISCIQYLDSNENISQSIDYEMKKQPNANTLCLIFHDNMQSNSTCVTLFSRCFHDIQSASHIHSFIHTVYDHIQTNGCENSLMHIIHDRMYEEHLDSIDHSYASKIYDIKSRQPKQKSFIQFFNPVSDYTLKDTQIHTLHFEKMVWSNIQDFCSIHGLDPFQFISKALSLSTSNMYVCTSHAKMIHSVSIYPNECNDIICIFHTSEDSELHVSCMYKHALQHQVIMDGYKRIIQSVEDIQYIEER